MPIVRVAETLALKGGRVSLHDTWPAFAALVWSIDSLGRETLLFAAVAFLIGGIDDLALDLFYLGRRAIKLERAG